MELPNYRLPVARNVLRLLWDKARDFLQRAFTVIFLASIVIWLYLSSRFKGGGYLRMMSVLPMWLRSWALVT